MAEDDFIGLPPGMVDSGTLRSPARAERPRTEKRPVVFVPTVPGMPVPPVDIDDVSDETRPEHLDTLSDGPARESSTAAETPRGWIVKMLDGSTATITGAVVIGRNPTRTAHWHHASLLPLDDPTQSVSKTHAALDVDGSGLWVHDLDSTNGVWVVVGEDATEVAPGRRVSVPRGASIELGDYVLAVVAD